MREQFLLFLIKWTVDPDFHLEECRRGAKQVALYRVSPIVAPFSYIRLQSIDIE